MQPKESILRDIVRDIPPRGHAKSKRPNAVLVALDEYGESVHLAGTEPVHKFSIGCIARIGWRPFLRHNDILHAPMERCQ